MVVFVIKQTAVEVTIAVPLPGILLHLVLYKKYSLINDE